MRLVHIVQQLAPLPKRTQWQQYSAAAGVAMLQEVAARVSTAVTYSFEIDAGKYGLAWPSGSASDVHGAQCMGWCLPPAADGFHLGILSFIYHIVGLLCGPDVPEVVSS
jgi:hypothetical protein